MIGQTNRQTDKHFGAIYLSLQKQTKNSDRFRFYSKKKLIYNTELLIMFEQINHTPLKLQAKPFDSLEKYIFGNLFVYITFSGRNH